MSQKHEDSILVSKYGDCGSAADALQTHFQQTFAPQDRRDDAIKCNDIERS